MPFKSGYKTVYYIGDELLETRTGLKTKTGKPVVYSEIIQQYNKDNPFVDIDFPTDDSSVDAKKLNFDAARGIPKNPNWDGTVVWKKPQEALRLHHKTLYPSDQNPIKYVFSQPSVKDKSAKSRFDITQGRIGDCWMVSALSQATQKAEIIDFVVPDDNLTNNDSGAYHFRYYFRGEYVDVVVDEYLPLFEEDGPGNGYTILICNPPIENGVFEIWPLLAEKAYAKIQGTIQQLDGGVASFALQDLTAGITENISIAENVQNESILFDMLMGLNKMNFVGLGTPNDDAVKEFGLAPQHAYCVTALTTVTYKGEKVNLIRVRNPWGEQEWNGPWSDSSAQFKDLSEEDKKKVGLVIDEDGEFWISADDVFKHFDSIESCYWFPEALMPVIAKSFDIQTYHSEFTTANSNQVEPWNNPQFVIEVKGKPGEEDCAILANIMLKCKMRDTSNFPAVSCYKIIDGSKWPDNKFTQEFFSFENYSKRHVVAGVALIQQRNTGGFRVAPGKYVIVACLAGEPANYGFVLRLAGQILPTEDAHSMAEQVAVAGDVNTDTGLAKQKATNGNAADPVAKQNADGSQQVSLQIDDPSWFATFQAGGEVDTSKLSAGDRKVYDMLKGYSQQTTDAQGNPIKQIWTQMSTNFLTDNYG